MSLNYHVGDLLAIEEGIIIHGCNARGIMGAGVALAVKKKYPLAYDTYVRDALHFIGLGQVSWYAHLIGQAGGDKLTICSAITQSKYGRNPKYQYVQYEAIESCFVEIFECTANYDVQYHMPKIGAGYGNGDWDIISEIIVSVADRFGIDHSRLHVWTLK